MSRCTIHDLKDRGISLAGASRLFDPANPPKQAAMDAALATAPNTGIPAELTTFLSTSVVPVLTRPRRARAIINEVIKGNATTTTTKFPQVEYLGETAPYSDFSQAGRAGVNTDWPARDNYLFQTIREVGDFESELSGLAKVALAAETQKAAAFILDNDHNKFAFLGVAGLRNYGLLNDPGLNPVIPPLAVTPSGGGATVTAWADKTAQQVYADFKALYNQLIQQLGGNDNVTNDGVDDEIHVAMSAESYEFLGNLSDHDRTVLDLLKNFFRKLKISTAPEYDTPSGQLVQMMLPNVEGQVTAEIAPSEKFHGFAPVRGLSSFAQKFRAGTFGTIIYRPAAIAGMLGV